MTQSEKWAEKALEDLRRVAALAKNIKPVLGAPSADNNAQEIDPTMVGNALAELLKNDNSLTQSIAVRLTNLASRYPNKAF